MWRMHWISHFLWSSQRFLAWTDIQILTISMYTISRGLRFYWSSKPIISAYQAQTMMVQIPKDIRHWKEWFNYTWTEAKMYMMGSSKIEYMDHNAKVILHCVKANLQRFFVKNQQPIECLTLFSRSLSLSVNTLVRLQKQLEKSHREQTFLDIFNGNIQLRKRISLFRFRAR